MDAFALPMDADPSRDPVVAYDEFGRPVRAGRLGTRYIQGAAPVQLNSLAGTPLSLADVMAASGGARGAGQPRQTSQLAPANAPEPSWGPLGGLANMLLEGFQAPGNALAGRPVMLGEVYGTAGTAALGGTAVPRPANALGANSFRAYHGSPHSFDKFSLDKIGTGTGAQSHGRGVYVSESEGVARGYRDSLSTRVTVDGNPIVTANKRVGSTGDKNLDDLLSAHNGDLEAAIADQSAYVAQAGSAPYAAGERVTLEKLEALRGRVDSKTAGSMYEMNVNADPNDFLDSGLPLSKQSEAVRRALEPLIAGMKDARINEFDRKAILSGKATGADLYNALKYSASGDGASAATDAIRSNGIPGIRFSDGASGSRNFVVFDDKLIDIVRKYGWAAAAPMLAQMGMTPEQAQAQYEAQN